MTDLKRGAPAEPVLLADFIRQNMPLIVNEWSSFAETRTPASRNMTASALRDHIEEILAFIVSDLETVQTSAQQALKSRGDQPKEEGAKQTPAETHAALRLSDGFDMDQMVSEYRALRASVIKLWNDGRNDFDRQDMNDLIRFNEAVDQSITESIHHFTVILDRSRNLFLGILGHDLRNPIGAASMCTEAMIVSGKLDAKQHRLAVQVRNCTLRASRIIEDLLDLTRVQSGSELPVSRCKMDLAALSEQVTDEVLALYPGRIVNVSTSGNMDVEWDPSRIGQALSNLLGNAMAHGSKHAPVNLVLRGDVDQVTLTVQNEGDIIPPAKIDTIFDVFARGEKNNAERSTTLHLGLGLFITKQIIAAHGGTLGVTSDREQGTKFIAVLPRK